ncbi:MAG: hypothetical protein CM15mP117_20030 [Alphaproteobacteria bacterium]|nr:MAG: hypothetical protein CM15mP117_20030 [Alphaproteobacteria bacterium]
MEFVVKVSPQLTVLWLLWQRERFDPGLVHTHTFDMNDLPEAIRYAKERVDDA